VVGDGPCEAIGETGLLGVEADERHHGLAEIALPRLPTVGV
jgi:hypothetical protein